jgi:DNA mismatch repair protein MutL
MTASEIQELDAQTVERIAAGEVVERPASVVKELVENSIDAGATRVTVAVDSGGTDGIRVTDDGEGMSRAELERAVEKHTTSKIRDIDDLESGVGTLGFRGEALHAIGAVSRTTITSRPQDGGQATELSVEGGEITDISPAGAPPGTTVEVHDLFYNVPARRKYLKQESTEFAHVNTVTTSYALANPDVAVTLEHNGRETFATTGTGDLREAVLAVYGREVAESMRDVSGQDRPDGPLQSVRGLVSHPETNRATRDYLSTFVNGRYVTAGAVRDAIVEAYDRQLAADRYPFAVLFLAVDPGTVDVNVHPRKLEVRFADEEGVRDQVQSAVEAALLRDGLLRSAAPRGQSAPDEAEIQPEQSQETLEETDSTATQQPGTVSESTAQSNDETQSRASGDENTTALDTPETRPETTQQPSPSNDAQSGGSVSQGTNKSTDSAERDSRQPPTSSGQPSTETPEQRRRQRDAEDRRRKFRDTGKQDRLVEEDTDGQFEQLPSMRILGQYDETYIVAETADGLVLIDQHAADERINYERLQESFSGETTTQTLAEPVRLEVTAQESALFEAHSEALARIGFHAERVDSQHIEVRTVPATVTDSAGPELIRDVLGEFVTGAESAADTVEAAVDDLLADLACYPSITGNTALTEGSVVDLLERLDACTNPYACPHGRPVIVEFDTDEIEARFERDYPGHG